MNWIHSQVIRRHGKNKLLKETKWNIARFFIFPIRDSKIWRILEKPLIEAFKITKGTSFFF